MAAAAASPLSLSPSLSTESAGTLNVRPRLPGLNAPSGVRWTVSGMGEEDTVREWKNKGRGGREGGSGRKEWR